MKDEFDIRKKIAKLQERALHNAVFHARNVMGFFGNYILLETDAGGQYLLETTDIIAFETVELWDEWQTTGNDPQINIYDDIMYVTEEEQDEDDTMLAQYDRFFATM